MLLSRHTRRREFIAGVGGAAAWSLAARAQQPPGKMRRLGVLQPGAPPDPLVEAMQEGCVNLVTVKGGTLPLNFGGRRESSAAYPVGNGTRRLESGCNHRIQHARRHSGAESYHDHSDRFLGGRRSSRDRTCVGFARPGGNVTGLSVLATELAAKRLEILEKIVPSVPLGYVLERHQSQHGALC